MIWTNLENSMLSQRSQTQKATHYMTPCMGNVQKRQIQRQKGDEGCHKAGGVGNREWLPMGWVSLGNDGNVLELNCSDGCGQLTCYYKQHMLKWLKWWILLCDFISKKNLLKKKTICWPLSMSVEYYCSDPNHRLWKRTSRVWTQAPHVRAVCLGWNYLITSQSFPYITCKYGTNISCLRL